MNIKINFGRIPYSSFLYNGDFLLLAYMFGVILAYVSGLRFIVEGIFLAITFVLVGFYPAFILLIVALMYSLFMSVSDGIASLSLVYYVLLSLTVSGNIKFKLPKVRIIYLCFGVLLYFIIVDEIRSLLRPSGAFNSPLSASYFIACCILLLSAHKRFMGVSFALPSILLPGSRAGFLLSLVAFKNFSKLVKFVLLFTSPILGLLAVSLNVRAVTLHSTSDSRRFDSWMKIFHLDDPELVQIFMGYGRSQLGSLGQALGTEQTISLESSFLGLFYSYGIIGFIVFLILVLTFAYRNSIYWWVFFIISSVSVIMDSLSISLIIVMSLSVLLDAHKTERSF